MLCCYTVLDFLIIDNRERGRKGNANTMNQIEMNVDVLCSVQDAEIIVKFCLSFVHVVLNCVCECGCNWE